MTKFKGSILSRKLEADPNCPTVPMGHFTSDPESGQLWHKQPFVPPQATLVTTSKAFYSSSNGQENTADTDPDDSASSPIMDLTMSINGASHQQDQQQSSHQQQQQQPQRNSNSPRGFGEQAGSENAVHHMLGQFVDAVSVADRNNNSIASKFPSATTASGGQQYRQPWDQGNGGSATNAVQNQAATGGLPHEQHLASPTSSAFMSNSDSTPSTLVLATLKKRKRKPQPIPEDCKDDAYWERRKRNNESAKRSREMRRIKEQQTTMRVIYLEQENLRLKTETDMLRSEMEKLREMLYNRNSFQNGTV